MAIFLDPASDARLDFGDLTVDAATEFTVAVTFKPTTTPVNDNFLVSKWGDGFNTQSFVLNVSNTDEIGFAVSNGSATAYYGKQTTSVNVTSGTTYRIVARITFGSPPVVDIWVNGVSQSLTAFVGSNNVTAMIGGTGPLTVGHQPTAVARDGVEGDYSEVACWLDVIPDWMCVAYGAGMSPLAWRTNGLFYAPLINTSPCVDVWTGIVPTQTAAANAAHPAVFYPGVAQPAYGAAAGGGSEAMSALAGIFQGSVFQSLAFGGGVLR